MHLQKKAPLHDQLVGAACRRDWKCEFEALVAFRLARFMGCAMGIFFGRFRSYSDLLYVEPQKRAMTFRRAVRD
jgi:hypothetical protein